MNPSLAAKSITSIFGHIIWLVLWLKTVYHWRKTLYSWKTLIQTLPQSKYIFIPLQWDMNSNKGTFRRCFIKHSSSSMWLKNILNRKWACERDTFTIHKDWKFVDCDSGWFRRQSNWVLTLFDLTLTDKQTTTFNTDLPSRNNPQDEHRVCQLQSEHKTWKVPHQSTESYGQERASLTGTDFGNISKK